MSRTPRGLRKNEKNETETEIEGKAGPGCGVCPLVDEQSPEPGQQLLFIAKCQEVLLKVNKRGLCAFL